MITALQILAALLLDRLLGEPRRWHPLVGFGRLAERVEAGARRFAGASPRGLRLAGAVAWGLAVLPWVGMAVLAARQPDALAIPLGILLLWLALGGRSLAEHARAVDAALRAGDLSAAREGVGRMVSRETAGMDAAAVRRATVESVLENGNDAVFGALFWFLLAGMPGVVLYRLANTLDAMWGYRNDRYRHFGTVAARVDDLLNWLPARLTALAYGLAGRLPEALACWRRQAGRWQGVNPGVVMAAGAGALGVRLGGPARYHGRSIDRPTLGPDTRAAIDEAAIERSLALLRRAVWIGVAAVFAAGFGLA